MAQGPDSLPDVLRKLRNTPVESKADLPHWYAQSADVANFITIPAISESIPKESWNRLWHYLHDADIRLKDPEYAETQDLMLLDIIRGIESLLDLNDSGI